MKRVTPETAVKLLYSLPSRVLSHTHAHTWAHTLGTQARVAELHWGSPSRGRAGRSSGRTAAGGTAGGSPSAAGPARTGTRQSRSGCPCPCPPPGTARRRSTASSGPEEGTGSAGPRHGPWPSFRLHRPRGRNGGETECGPRGTGGRAPGPGPQGAEGWCSLGAAGWLTGWWLSRARRLALCWWLLSVSPAEHPPRRVAPPGAAHGELPKAPPTALRSASLAPFQGRHPVGQISAGGAIRPGLFLATGLCPKESAGWGEAKGCPDVPEHWP